MGKLVEGDRAFDAVTDTAAQAADVNGLQDELKVLMGPRTVPIPLSGGIAVVAGGNEWVYGNTGTWTQGGAAAVVLHIPVHIRDGEEIKSIHTIIRGNAGNTGGVVRLRSKTNATTPVFTTEVDVDSTNPFALAANTLVESTGLSVVAATNKEYFMEYLGSTVMPGASVVESLYMVRQFGT